MSNGIGWLGIEGLAFVAAGAGASAADVDADAAGEAGFGVVPFAFAGVFLTGAAAGAGEADALTGGVARGVLRLVALVSVGCIVGGRTIIGDAAVLGGEAAGGRPDVGVGGSVDANVSPE